MLITARQTYDHVVQALLLTVIPLAPLVETTAEIMVRLQTICQFKQFKSEVVVLWIMMSGQYTITITETSELRDLLASKFLKLAKKQMTA